MLKSKVDKGEQAGLFRNNSSGYDKEENEIHLKKRNYQQNDIETQRDLLPNSPKETYDGGQSQQTALSNLLGSPSPDKLSKDNSQSQDLIVKPTLKTGLKYNLGKS